MTERSSRGKGRRRPHAAAFSRIAVGGLAVTASSAMVTSMALSGAGGQPRGATGLTAPAASSINVPQATPASPAVVVRRSQTARRDTQARSRGSADRTLQRRRSSRRAMISRSSR